MREMDTLLVKFDDWFSMISKKDELDFDDLLVDFPNRGQSLWCSFDDDSCSVVSNSIISLSGESFLDLTQVMFMENLAAVYKQDLLLSETNIKNK